LWDNPSDEKLAALAADGRGETRLCAGLESPQSKVAAHSTIKPSAPDLVGFFVVSDPSGESSPAKGVAKGESSMSKDVDQLKRDAREGEMRVSAQKFAFRRNNFAN